MKAELLKIMRCPYCGSDLNLGEIYEEEEEEIINGWVRCECGQFPVIEGILNLKIGLANSYLVDTLSKGRTKKSILPLLESYVEYLSKITAVLESKGSLGTLLAKILQSFYQTKARYTYRKYIDGGSSFFELLGKSSSDTYLKHRFSWETLWSVYPFIPLLKRKRARILDIGCGAGHASFLISTYVHPEELICADRSFRNLYLARKYFARKAQFICLDASYPLPFKDSIFDSIFMLDAFHYVQARASLAREMERTLLPQGLLLLLHLHNALQYNPGTAKPLSPSSWVNLFHQLPVKALPERNLVEDFLLKNELNLAKDYPQAALDASNAICLVGTRQESLLKLYKEVGNDFLSNKANLTINPIYEVTHKPDKLILRRHFPSEEFREEYPLTEKFLPEEYAVEGELINLVKEGAFDIAPGDLSESDFRQIEDLMKRFVLINVPENYC